jgi:hypothetical protein
MHCNLTSQIVRIVSLISLVMLLFMCPQVPLATAGRVVACLIDAPHDMPACCEDTQASEGMRTISV